MDVVVQCSESLREYIDTITHLESAASVVLFSWYNRSEEGKADLFRDATDAHVSNNKKHRVFKNYTMKDFKCFFYVQKLDVEMKHSLSRWKPAEIRVSTMVRVYCTLVSEAGNYFNVFKRIKMISMHIWNIML